MSDTTSKNKDGAQNPQAMQQNGGATPPQNGNLAEWTIIIYIAADSNLANFAIESLKQLNATANDQVKVAVQFAVDAPGGQKIPRYIFDGCPDQKPCPDRPISASLDSFLDAPKNMTEQEALTSLLHWVFYEKKRHNKDTTAKYYALILWGHGPELLFEPPSGRIPTNPCGDPGDDNNGLFLTPIELRDALKKGLRPDPNLCDASQHTDSDTKKPHIDVIGFDACSMALLEVAYEIRGSVDFMIASQEEVPDLSFPYDRLVSYIMSLQGKMPEELCENLIKMYGTTYQDYICNANTGMKKVTLSAIRLKHLCVLKDALARLAHLLYCARHEPGLPDLLIDCRARAKGFAGGLYVDIFSFCDKLRAALVIPPIPKEMAQVISDVCVDVCNALLLPEDEEHNNNNCILANLASDTSECHGLSIYFPYMKNEEVEEIRQPLVKGGTDTVGKGFAAIMNRVAANTLQSIRRGLVLDTEAYYADLFLAIDTCWYEFIAKVWTRVLTRRVPTELDLRYSAQQAAVNLLKKVNCTNKLCPENSSAEAGADNKD